MAKADEIVVRGRKPKGGPGAIPGSYPGPARGSGGEYGFAPPPVLPGVIDEIIVTAQRQTSSQIIRAGAIRLAGAALGYLGLGAYGIYELDRYRQALENELDEKSKVDADNRRLNRLAAEQPLPEIIVTAKAPAPAPAPAPYVLPIINPLITPDVDPFIMQPIVPAVQPAVTQPATKPKIDVAPVIAPSIPAVAPATIPARPVLPFVLPFATPAGLPIPAPVPRTAPQTRPATRPAVRPAPATSPAVSPFAQPATRAAQSLGQAIQSLTATQSSALSFPEPFAAQAPAPPAPGNCPPCAKDEEPEKARSECWRKLVKEGLYPSQDKEYQWVQIDCFTGREL